MDESFGLTVVLIGLHHWQLIVRWFYDLALKNGLIDERLTKLFVVTDSIDEAFDIIYGACKYYLDE